MTVVLVTGGAGYIGSHACKALTKAGCQPVAFDNMSLGHDWAVKWGPLERGDIRDKERVLEVMEAHRPDAVMHFAGQAYVRESVTDPASYFSNNVVGSHCLLEAMRERGIGKIIFSSSCSTYGAVNAGPVTEQTPQAPISPYGASKLMVERMLDDYDTAYGLLSASLRYFNACGADPETEIGEDHDPEPHLIPRALMAAAGQLESLDVLGTDYPTPDGTCIRDYVHVSDLADAHVKALSYLQDGGETTALNLGSGQGFSVRQVVDAVERVTGKNVATRNLERQPGDVAQLFADGSLAQRVLGFDPVITDLDEIVATAWAWYQKHGLGQ